MTSTSSQGGHGWSVSPRVAIAPAVAESVCRELGLEWRNTTLTPPQVLSLLIRLTGLNVTPAAYCTAKMRLPTEALREVSRRVCDAAHLMCLFSATSGLVRDVVASPLRTHDLATALQVHPHLRRGDIAIADTAFGSYFHIAVLSVIEKGSLLISKKPFPYHKISSDPFSPAGLSPA